MGSTSITLGEVVAPTSPTEVPSPASIARGRLATLVFFTSGEASLLSAAPRGGVVVRASSTRVSPTTFRSADLMWDGEAGATRSSCGTTVGLQGNVTSNTRIHQQAKKIEFSRFYLKEIRISSFGLKGRDLSTAGIFACIATTVRCSCNPRCRASSDVFSTNSHCLLAAGLSGLLAGRDTSTDGSSTASSFSSSSDSTSSIGMS
jgi:hypothetical protein